MKKLVVWLLAFALYSCTTSIDQLLDSTGYLSCKNVFSSTDMSVFCGFVDKIPVSKLIKVYGEPDSIYDSFELYGEKGYDIYEYDVDGGKIACFVENVTEYINKNVEFLYFEPDSFIPLDSFILDKKLFSQIKNAERNVYYFKDLFGNYIRIRVNENDINKIINVAYNDCRYLPLKFGTIKDVTREMDEDLPEELGDIGLLKGFDFSDNCLTLTIDANEKDNETISHLFDKTPSLAEDIAIFIMCDGGCIPLLDDILVEKKASIKFVISGVRSGQKITKVLSSDDVKNLFSHKISNERNLRAQINLVQCFRPKKITSWLSAIFTNSIGVAGILK